MDPASVNEKLPSALVENSFFAPLVDQALGFLTEVQNNFGKIVGGLVVLVVLLIIAWVLKGIIRAVLKKLRVDSISEKVALKDTIAKLGITAPISKIVSSIVYWMVAIYAVKVTADIWGVTDISNFITALILFIPKLIIAAFILFGGLLGADIVKKLIHRSLENIGIDYGALVGSAVSILIIVMVATVVLGQLGIETQLLNSTVVIMVAAIGLAIALSLGLGLRSVAQNVVSGVYARDLFPPGSVLEIDDSMAQVREVGAVATRLESGDGTFFVIPNHILVNQVNKGVARVQKVAKNT